MKSSKRNTLYEVFEDTVSKRANKTAVFEGKRKISFEQLKEYSESVATYLVTYGIKKGDRVGVFMHNCWQYTVIALAVSKVGGVLVPINTYLKSSELSYILKDADIDLVFASDELFNIIKGSIAVINYGQVVWIGKDVRGTRFEKLLTITNRINKINIDLDDEAAIFYTSGTTGKYKGAIITNKNMLAAMPHLINRLDLSFKDRLLIFLPFFHSYAFNIGIVSLAFGITISILPSARAFDIFLKEIITRRITIIFGVPELYKIFVDMNLPLSFKLLNRLRLVITGGSFISQELLIAMQSKFKKAKIIEGYGLTETSAIVSLNYIKNQKINSLGKPIECCEVKIVSEDRKKELNYNEIGEIVVRGDNVIKKYLNCDCKNIIDNWLYTGDIGYLDSDGYLYIIDRKSDIIISKGLNIYPKEIEQVINRYPGIKSSAVIGMKDKKNGEIPIAFIEVEEMQIDEDKLSSYAKGFLADYKVPKKFIIIEKIPRTSTGKIMKYKLQEYL